MFLFHDFGPPSSSSILLANEFFVADAFQVNDFEKKILFIARGFFSRVSFSFFLFFQLFPLPPPLPLSSSLFFALPRKNALPVIFFHVVFDCFLLRKIWANVYRITTRRALNVIIYDICRIEFVKQLINYAGRTTHLNDSLKSWEKNLEALPVSLYTTVHKYLPTS